MLQSSKEATKGLLNLSDMANKEIRRQEDIASKLQVCVCRDMVQYKLLKEDCILMISWTHRPQMFSIKRPVSNVQYNSSKQKKHSSRIRTTRSSTVHRGWGDMHGLGDMCGPRGVCGPGGIVGSPYPTPPLPWTDKHV